LSIRALLPALFVFCVASPVARADSAPSPQPDWSVAAGLSFPVAGAVLLGGQTITNTSGNTSSTVLTPSFNFAVPGGTVMAERRLRGNTWLMLQLTVIGSNFTGAEHGSAVTNGEAPTTSNSAVGLTASLGVRRAYFTWSRIILSWFLVASYSSQTTTSSSTVNVPDGFGSTNMQTVLIASQAWGVGGAFGLQFDVVLIENVLLLQIGTPLLDLTYSRQFTQTRSTQSNNSPLGSAVANASADEGGLSGGLAFSPTLALRMLF
jgi:hypothetical protein